MNKMYIEEARIVNLGAIKRAEVNFQFDNTGNPNPILLVGPNGSGKTLFLASIVNSLIETINCFHSRDHRHNFMSSDYIGDSADYVWKHVKFTHDYSFYSLILHSPKTDELPLQFDDEVMQNIYDEMADGSISTNSWDFALDSNVQSAFVDNCILYLPVNRFEDPIWLMKDWESQKSQHVQVMDGGSIQDLRYSIIEYSSLKKNKQWVRSVLDNNITISSDIHKLVRQLDHEIASGKGTLEENILSRSDAYLIDYFQLSSGEAMIVNIFFSILRRFGSYERNTRISDISGIVMVDEIDLHLHTSYQYQNLPKLMKLFPSIQFIVTTHSPFFVLGMEEVFGSDGFCVYEFPWGCQISAEDFGEFKDAFQSMKRTDRFKKEIKDAQEPIVILEGETDKKYLLKASELLGKEDVIRRIELKCGNGFPSLDSIWKRWRKDSIRMILLYDCDCKRDDRTDSVIIKNIPKQEGHPIEKGIENLFARKILDEAALKVDKDRIEDLVNYKNGKLGKKEYICDWICENGTKEDFKHFESIFSILEDACQFFKNK